MNIRFLYLFLYSQWDRKKRRCLP